ncbi:dienelactone hydrolase [Rhodopseudomonas rhenobacensis]|uniref:Dienelactone hydrolase n=1 Tax=Rhodopseudomonas rhenobacensis TaxID=87461 RepID=A0A7W8DYM0_9BRAD|nr:dienelactone hydrolase family protein [Rhodopseudomonas rhenobacensis]MBB5046011.1 dienelactone hydrolase [Rhodopseudomonas rhenobacensis]
MGGSRRRAIAAAVALLLGWSAPAAAASALPAPQAVDLPRAAGLLHALLYKPGGDGPFPTVIALHGCGGLSAGAEPLRARYVDWVQHLLKAGHAVLLPDSYGSRELGPQCRLKERRVQARRERVADIATARQWLLQQPWVTKQRISLLGFANGASALLWAVRPQSAFAQSGPDVRSAVAFYPDCRLSSGLGWSARVPTLLLIGGSDDVSSPAACRQMIDGARGRSALAKLVVYPGAAHGFDRLNVALHDTDHSASADEPDHGHVGSDPTARADAEKRVAGWLGR